jgi:2-dehydropantoate 2-reductase
MHLLVIGAGAVGAFVGARLALAGHDVCLVGRPALLDAVRASGLTLIEPDASPRTTTPHCVNSISSAFTDTAQYELALLTVKAYDTDAVIGELRAATDNVPSILTLQNGVGNEEALADAFGADAVLSGAIDTRVSVPRPGQVQAHKARYGIGLATLRDREALVRAAGALTEAGFTIRQFADYRSLKWTKLLMNILANAQCAILGWTPVQVMADPTASELEARAWQEAVSVMRRSGIAPVALGGYPFPQILPVAERLRAPWLARFLRRYVSGGRGTKLPSLYLALEAGKPSEVRWLNGAVARHGQLIGVPVPVNAIFTQTLEGLTAGKTPLSAFRNEPRKLAAAAGIPVQRAGRK